MRISLAAATAEVAARDAALARVVELAGPLQYRPRDPDGPFGALVRAIVYQQLAGRAAAAIHGRVRAAVGALSPAALAAAPDEVLRGAGLSGNKLASLRDLSAKVLDGTVDLARVSKLGDDDLVAALVTVRGIGRWTAEMFLMFELRRLDVWPVDDLGVRQGYGLAWRLDTPPAAKELDPLGDRFRPYRSIVARYCWAAVALAREGVDLGPPRDARSERIVQRIREIPEGYVRTYGDIDSAAPRLVGHVLATADGLPWHRVVRADGTLTQGARQRKLLQQEGVPMRGDRVDLREARLPVDL